jgi:hypothetical protein
VLNYSTESIQINCTINTYSLEQHRLDCEYNATICNESGTISLKYRAWISRSDISCASNYSCTSSTSCLHHKYFNNFNYLNSEFNLML